ncbi:MULTISPECIES: P-II family nitrogen regulator [Clostridium]|uniref:Nitrogen fixation protein NifHD n=2 Tax=Clostridium TaxID=1485 RepID=A0A1S9N690_CLOBE|nr:MULTISPECIES: P-II family nitrogen regulator [Clostridium]EKQ54836.1 MAG: nitrogen regulatory protein PII [Clostridium sp. Maddingley MBC34-26]MZK51569.1 P-II family nitrogen regulator [Clostridium beijerinckii]MZK59844.1 P-II family nitrogen regulator [Clostridium beijerinckii]MZK70129.1 P-II family nitrogen regulator [Clostridium beijerinckii]MZK75372.1 P-II family nitrogen regulator [Clostridium beijerinckii]
MKMIKAIIRPEKCEEVLKKMCDNGFRAVTRFGILGRGKQRGLKVEDVYYDEIPKETLMIVVDDSDVDKVTDIIVKNSRTSNEGSFGDGKIFILPVEKVITISNGKNEL